MGEGVWPSNKVVGVAWHHLQEFQQVRRCPSKQVCAQRPRWKPPDTGLLKVNFDGAIFDDLRVVAEPGIYIMGGKIKRQDWK